MDVETLPRRRQPDRRLWASRTAVLGCEDLLSEILVRLSPLPSSLARAACVCREWRRLVADPAFLRLLRAHRRRRVPPVLGVFEKMGRDALFKPCLNAPERVPPERFTLRVGAGGSWNLMGCRHGRLLALNRTRKEVLVFSPVSRNLRRIPAPWQFIWKIGINGAVVSSAAAGASAAAQTASAAFKVVLVATISNSPSSAAIARVYSSAAGVWGDVITSEQPCPGFVNSLIPSTLVGDALYWRLHNHGDDAILQFDLGTQKLTVISMPPVVKNTSSIGRIIRAEDGAVGFALLLWPSLQFWRMNVDRHGAAAWALRRTVQMDGVLGVDSTIETRMACVLGYSEEAHTAMISVRGRAFMVDLASMHSTKLDTTFLENTYYPFASFVSSGSVC